MYLGFHPCKFRSRSKSWHFSAKDLTYCVIFIVTVLSWLKTASVVSFHKQILAGGAGCHRQPPLPHLPPPFQPAAYIAKFCFLVSIRLFVSKVWQSNRSTHSFRNELIFLSFHSVSDCCGGLSVSFSSSVHSRSRVVNVKQGLNDV